MKISTIYCKNSFVLKNTTAKHKDLGHTRLGGFIVEAGWKPAATAFNMQDYIRVSKKHRSNIVEVVERDVFQYCFCGICIKHQAYHGDLNASFLLRNVFSSIPFETSIVLYSPIIDFIGAFVDRKKLIGVIRNKFYYLRKKPLPRSHVPFMYIIGMYNRDFLKGKQEPSFISYKYKYLTTKKDK